MDSMSEKLRARVALDNDRDELPAIERVSGVSLQAFTTDYRRRLRPVVLTDATQRWKANERWTPEYFKSVLGDREVVVDEVRYRFDELVDRILRSTPEQPGPYLRSVPVRETFPELWPDVQPRVRYAERDRLSSRFLPAGGYGAGGVGYLGEVFFGGAGAGFPILHVDAGHAHAFSSQIYGKKEFILFPPSATRYLYVDRSRGVPGRPNLSLIPNVFEPAFDEFPLVRQAESVRVTLEPGDTLFIPGGWWHTTRMLTVSISVSTSCVTKSNWREYRKDIIEAERADRPVVKTLAKDAFLRLSGSLMTLQERATLRRQRNA